MSILDKTSGNSHRSSGLEKLRKDNNRIYEILMNQYAGLQGCDDYHSNLMGALRAEDSDIYELIKSEYDRTRNTLQLIAAENECSRAVLAALGSVVQNKTTEGFVGHRYHGGCQVIDKMETLACERAKETFKAGYANVQPHSGTAANHIVMMAILKKGDKILSQGLDQGGHVSHGADVSFTSKLFEVDNYYVDRHRYLLDYNLILAQAKKFRPKLIICGASAYSRAIDFSKFRQIADEVGAYLMADISHISSLVIAGAHQSPIDHAHFTTTSTYKPGGPRGGLVLMGRDFDKTIEVNGKELPLSKLVDKSTFPGVQGTPYLNHIAAKAVFFKETMGSEYRERQFRVIENAKRLADNFVRMGYAVLTGGTDNHMVLIDVLKSKGLTGLIAQKALEDCGIIVNMNRLAYDTKKPSVTSGMRLGTPIVTKKGMSVKQMDLISDLINKVLSSVKVVDDRQYQLDTPVRETTVERVRDLCNNFVKY